MISSRPAGQCTARQWGEQGFQLSPQKSASFCESVAYCLQSTNKTLEGASHLDRNEQFEFINERVDEFQARGAPVISVDTIDRRAFSPAAVDCR